MRKPSSFSAGLPACVRPCGSSPLLLLLLLLSQSSQPLITVPSEVPRQQSGSDRWWWRLWLRCPAPEDESRALTWCRVLPFSPLYRVHFGRSVGHFMAHYL
uniref:Putative secreted protein n=1 Tax=Anopheles triannulatus TaxID=58253 RepID=A0A2M4B378_9DIPT